MYPTPLCQPTWSFWCSRLHCVLHFSSFFPLFFIFIFGDQSAAQGDKDSLCALTPISPQILSQHKFLEILSVIYMKVCFICQYTYFSFSGYPQFKNTNEVLLGQCNAPNLLDRFGSIKSGNKLHISEIQLWGPECPCYFSVCFILARLLITDWDPIMGSL